MYNLLYWSIFINSQLDKVTLYPFWAITMIFITLWATSVDDKLMMFFLFFTENGIQHFKQIVSNEDNLHEMSNLISWENKKNISKCCLLKISDRVLSVSIDR